VRIIQLCKPQQRCPKFPSSIDFLNPGAHHCKVRVHIRGLPCIASQTYFTFYCVTLQITCNEMAKLVRVRL
jgi:hypothetical protein